MDGGLRLIFADSGMTVNYPCVGSAIKKLAESCVDLSKCREHEFKVDLTSDYDVFKDFFIDSSYGADLIKSASILFVGSMPICEVSGRALRVMKALKNPQFDRGMIELPFPAIEKTRMPYSTVRVLIKMSVCGIYAQIKECIPNCVCSSVADIICDCALDNPTISLWARCITDDQEVNVQRNGSAGPVPIVSYQEARTTILAEQTSMAWNSCFHGLTNKIIFWFVREDDPNEQPLDILVNYEFSTRNCLLYDGTGRSAHVFDKVLSGAHVPDDPIYTTTFEHKCPLPNKMYPHSRINFSRDGIKLVVNVRAQPFNVVMHILGEYLNEIKNNNGAGYMRYTF